MTVEGFKRKLTAIFSKDVKGYSGPGVLVGCQDSDLTHAG